MLDRTPLTCSCVPPPVTLRVRVAATATGVTATVGERAAAIGAATRGVTLAVVRLAPTAVRTGPPARNDAAARGAGPLPGAAQATGVPSPELRNAALGQRVRVSTVAQAVSVPLLLVIEPREAPRPARDALLRGPPAGAPAAPLVSPLGGDGPLAAEVVLPRGLPLQEANGNEVARAGRGPVAQIPRTPPLGALRRPRRHPLRPGERFPHPA